MNVPSGEIAGRSALPVVISGTGWNRGAVPGGIFACGFATADTSTESEEDEGGAGEEPPGKAVAIVGIRTNVGVTGGIVACGVATADTSTESGADEGGAGDEVPGTTSGTEGTCTTVI